MDPCLIAHVLPQELHADVHQLHSVQGTAAPVGSAGGVGGHAGEVVLRLDTGVGGAGLDFVGVLRVPGDGGIQLLPKAVPGHEGLGGAALLTGAAVEDHGAGRVGGFQERLDPQGRSHGAGTQEIVSAAVAAAAGDPLLPFHAASLLGQAGERIVLRQDADDGASGAVAGGKGRGDVADPLLHGEALFFQDLTIKGGGPGLLQRELRVVPDAVRHLGDEVALGLHGGDGRLLGIITDGDLRRCLAPDMLSKKADDVMTRNPKTVAPDVLAAEAVNTMNNTGKGITQLFVVEDGKPVGIIHLHDCLRAGVA